MTQRDCGDCYYSKLEGEKEPCKSCKATDEGFTNWREVPLTNADRIRSMSDEELCEFMLSAPAIPCNAKISVMMERNNCDDCQACIMEWLQQPAEEADHEQ